MSDKGAAAKKEVPAHKPETQKVEAPVSKGKGHNVAPGGCHAHGCKGQEKRFTFCDEHFEQFKFGLIKKSGEPAPDYEKKFEHYQAMRRRAHKVA